MMRCSHNDGQNPAYWRHQLSRCVRIVVPILWNTALSSWFPKNCKHIQLCVFFCGPSHLFWSQGLKYGSPYFCPQVKKHDIKYLFLSYTFKGYKDSLKKWLKWNITNIIYSDINGAKIIYDNLTVAVNTITFLCTF